MQEVYPKIKSERRDGGKFILPKAVDIYFSSNAEFASALYAKMFCRFKDKLDNKSAIRNAVSI